MMKKYILIIVAVLGLAMPAHSQFASELYSNTHEYDGWLHKGYRGFVDIGGGRGSDVGTFSLTTTHGYQFSQWFFVGAGLGYEYTNTWVEYKGSTYVGWDDDNWFLLYLDLRLTIPTQSRFYPYANLKLGAELGSESTPYLRFGIGARYALNENLGLALGPFISVGYKDKASAGVTLTFDF